MEVGRDQVSQTILKKLQQVRSGTFLCFCTSMTCSKAFIDRPIWTRMSLFNQFTPAEARDIIKCAYSLKPIYSALR